MTSAGASNSVVRDAVDHSDFVCPQTVCDSLRSSEARTILEMLGVTVPNVPNTILRSAMREAFSQLQPAELHKAMVET